MKKALICLILVTWLDAPQSIAQEAGNFTHLVGGTVKVWKFTAPTRHHQAVVRVSVGRASGTGTIVYIDRTEASGTGFKGYCLTAYHVVRERAEAGPIKIHFRDGRSAKDCQVVAYDEEFDAALLLVWVPGDAVAAEVASTAIQGLDKIEICGLGGNSKLDCCLRSFTAAAALPTTPNQLYADVSLLPGDSGGPVFNMNGQVVGVISGGWFWWEAGVKSKAGEHVMATWPARAANTSVLQKLLSQVDNLDLPAVSIPQMQVASSTE